MPVSRWSFALASVLILALPLHADESPSKAEATKSVAEIAESARKSLVVVLHTGRDGKQDGLGTGFVVAKDGLIATNLHVIGEGRAIAVQFPDGKRHEVTAVHASDRKLDLAVVRIAARDLVPLELGDSGTLKPGQPIVALGHPRGLKYSVVSGVLSGQRDLDGMSMLQLAIPIETGNSGGPVLDMRGRVHGIVTMKAVTPNLGFAVPSNALKPLLAKPNPVPMSRWLTIGRLDKAEWRTVFGNGWRQRAGRIIADGAGTGFGGRTLCLAQQSLPKLPYEIAVTVKLDNETGAAGLVFASDGKDKHYGFYPSGGRLRLTSFNGPDVFSWKILKEFPTTHYHPGQWNTIKVRIESNKLLCYVNDHLEVEQEETGLTGAVGLAKFRNTVAEFRDFAVAPRIRSAKPSDEVIARLTKTIETISFKQAVSPKVIDALAPDGPTGMALLRQRAQQLEQQAAQLRKVAQAVHHQKSLADLAAAVAPPEDKLDLLRAALLIARLDNEDLEVASYAKEVDRMAREITESLSKGATDIAKLKALNRFLFQERGFHGSRFEYYTRANSYLNDVIEDREGLPITLSVLYMEIARRLGLNVVGVPLPGHFVVRHEPVKGPGQLIDVYDGGTFLSDDDADQIVRKFTGKSLKKEQLAAAAKKQILVRMLHNLMNVAQSEEDRDGVLRYLDGILTINPDSAQERWARAVLRFQAGQREAARADCDWLLEHHPAGVLLERVRELREILRRSAK
jgi:regulator of sirC expression with transglutaminase-like and TPR domain